MRVAVNASAPSEAVALRTHLARDGTLRSVFDFLRLRLPDLLRVEETLAAVQSERGAETVLVRSHRHRASVRSHFRRRLHFGRLRLTRRLRRDPIFGTTKRLHVGGCLRASVRSVRGVQTESDPRLTIGGQPILGPMLRRFLILLRQPDILGSATRAGAFRSIPRRADVRR